MPPIKALFCNIGCTMVKRIKLWLAGFLLEWRYQDVLTAMDELHHDWQMGYIPQDLYLSEKECLQELIERLQAQRRLLA